MLEIKNNDDQIGMKGDATLGRWSILINCLFYNLHNIIYIENIYQKLFYTLSELVKQVGYKSLV